MTLYNVHIYREIRLFFEGIEADTPQAAATIARDGLTSDADEIDDCEGTTLSALVDEVGDSKYERSVMIDFENERLRKAAPELLAALEGALYALDENMEGSGPSKQTAIDNARAAIAQTNGETPSSRDRTLTIEVRGGVVQDVSNVPPGWDYEIIDHDNAE
jgi:hypothetical protein